MASTGAWAVRAEALGKEYVLGEHAGRARSLYELLGDGWRRLRPSAQRRTRRERLWALRDVSFDIAPGEVVGVVGRNGAGKSTLLKLLSRITAPSEGRFVLRGNLASLLEVGTGFHPELTGRENVYLNGTILGMRRREIDRKFDQIVEFAEIERFLDTPVKRYSSGMYVRLAFAVAAHLDSDILLVDEVLAVGDLSFRRKSLGRMDEAARSGRTVVFVSHDLGAVRSLCQSLILIEGGRVRYRGDVASGLALYESGLVASGDSLESVRFTGPLSDRLTFESIRFLQGGVEAAVVDPTESLIVEIRGRAATAFSTLDLGVLVFRDGYKLFTCHDGPTGQPLAAGAFRSHIVVPAHTLRPGRYTLGLGAGRPGLAEWTWSPDVAVLEVLEHWDESCEARNEGVVNVRVEGMRES